ncbi:MAG TPA: PQQ-dependent sugar dehydrogenase [Mycobacteriales bacterium]|nr:PQQ-dependent sugar dehydrogenase [Mycobacteriales bacterium]
MTHRTAWTAAAMVVAVTLGGCRAGGEPAADDPVVSAPPNPALSSTALPTAVVGGPAPVALRLETVVDGLDTVWDVDFDPDGTLWWTERGGRLTRLGSAPQEIDGVDEEGEGGLMGLAFDRAGRPHVMFTGRSDNRVVRMEGQRQTVLVDGIPKGGIHDGGRLAFGPAGELYISTGDTGDTDLPQDDDSLAGKILRLDANSSDAVVHSKGHRNAQGLCFDGTGRLIATEHGPDRGDEVAVVGRGGNGGWPGTAGNGLKNYTPTIAPGGCAFYNAAAIPQWKGSLFFVTLKGRDLRRLTLDASGAVIGEEVLYDGELGRLRDVAAGPDGFLYLATSNRDGRGDDRADKIVRVRPA